MSGGAGEISGRPGGRILRFDVLGVVDASGFARSPASILVRFGEGKKWPGAEVLAVGQREEVSRHPAGAAAAAVALERSVVIPGLVNAHTHLDLTHIGARPFDAGSGPGGFVEWIDMIRRERRGDEEGVAASVRMGVEISLKAGTVAVGDIAGAAGARPSLAAWRALNGSPLLGVSYVEFFAVGARGAATVGERLGPALEASGQRGRVRVGLQPHAPVSVGLAAYRWAAERARESGIPICTHLAESPAEREFVARGSGPMREFLERLGLWDESVAAEVGMGRGPVEHLREVLGLAPFLAAHVNDADDAAIETLARTGTAVAYCPRASEYFGAARHFGAHRYREMALAGVNVCLGTDSTVNLPDGPGGLSILEEMRLLYHRDGTAPLLLLAMGTVNGAKALGLDPGLFRIRPGSSVAGLLAVPVEGGEGPLESVLKSEFPGTLLSAAK